MKKQIIVYIRFSDDLCVPSPVTILGSLTHKTFLNYFGCNSLWLGVVVLPSVVVIAESDFVFRFVELVWLVTVKVIYELNPEIMLMMITVDGVLNGVVVKKPERDFGEVVFGVLLGTDPVEIAELGGGGLSRVGARNKCSHTKKRRRWFIL